MADKVMSNSALKSLQWGMHDAVINGEIVRDIPSKMVYVADYDELYKFTDNVPVGTIAATYGFSYIWQLDAERQWVAV